MTGTHTGTELGTLPGHVRDSRAPSPSHSHSLKNVHPAEGGALWESPRGASPPAEPVAARRSEEHRASRRGPFSQEEIEPSHGFRLLCALIRRELAAHPALNWRDYADLVEHMKTAAAKAQLPYGQDKLTRALHAVEASRRPKVTRQPQSAPPVSHWRDRCAHTPRCATPTACALKMVRESR